MISFHRTLIITAILFCAGFAAWAFAAWSRDGGTGDLVLAAAFATFALGFVYYLKNLKRFLRR